MTAAWVRTIFAQPDQGGARQQLGQVAATLAKKLPSAGGGAPAEGGRPGNMAFPPSHWQQLHSTNTLERLNWETGRRCDVVEIFHNAKAALRMIGAALEEQHDDWQAVAHRYFGLGSMAPLYGEVAMEPESPVLTKGKEVTVVQPVRARGEPRPTHLTGRDPERP